MSTSSTVGTRPSRRALAATVTLLVVVSLTWMASPTIAGSSTTAGHGVLQVTTQPAVDSLISVDGIARNSGAITGLELEAGPHEICFTDAGDFLAPACEVHQVDEAQTTTVTGVFTPSGTLDVSVAPDGLEPVVTVDGVARDRGATLLKLGVGSYEVCGEEIPGYATPSCVDVDIVHGVTTDVELTYGTTADTDDGDAEPSTPPRGTNLLTDAQHSMETSEHGWVPQGNSVIGTDGSAAFIGDRSLRITADASGPWPDTTGTIRAGTKPGKAAVPVTVGDAYSGYVNVLATDHAAPARCEIRFYTSSGKILTTVEGPLAGLTSDVWSSLTCQAIAPPTAVTASLRVFFDQTSYGTTFFADDAWLTAVDAVSPEVPTDDEQDAPAPEPAPEPAPAPEPDPEPEPETSPPPPDGAPAGPDNTGVTSESALRPSGSISSERDGQVIENLEVTGTISVKHSNVTIRNVRVLGTGRYGIEVPHSLNGSVRGLVIEDTEIRGVSGDRSAGLVHYGQWAARRLDVSGFADGVKIGSNQTLEDSWIHGLFVSSTSHNDGIQAVSGSNIVIRGNTIEGQWRGQTSAILLQTNSGPIDGITLENNWLSGGGYTVYITDKGNGHGAPRNVTVRNNTWVDSSWAFGPTRLHEGTNWTWSGNVTTTGAPVNK